MLLIDQITFSYATNATPYCFSLTLERGKIATVHGQSGSGKSTLLDLIAGFLQPRSGELYWGNEAFTRKPPNLRPVTTIFQRNNLFEHRTALDNVVVGINPSLPKHGNEVDRAIDALKRVGLTDQIYQRAATLSGGQQQRVAIARSLCMEPKIMLFDEPTSALDPEMISEVLEVILELAEEGMTMIVVTHEMGFARKAANQMVFMDEGEIVEHGDPMQFFENPQTDRCRKFLNQILSH